MDTITLLLLLFGQIVTVFAFNNLSIFIIYFSWLTFLHCCHIKMEFNMSLSFTIIRSIPLISICAIYNIMPVVSVEIYKLMHAISTILFLAIAVSLPYQLSRLILKKYK